MENSTVSTAAQASTGRPSIATNVWSSTLANLALNVVLPTGMFYLLTTIGLSQWWSLLLSAIPPGCRAVWTLARSRRVDGFAIFIIAIMTLSVLTSLVTGSARLLLAKDAFMTFAAGTWMLVTLTRTPFLVQVFGSLAGGDWRQKLDQLWHSSAGFQRAMRVVTSIWGVGLVLDAVVRLVIALTVPVERVPAINSVQYVVAFLILAVSSRIYFKRAHLLATIKADSGMEFGK